MKYLEFKRLIESENKFELLNRNIILKVLDKGL
jgi:hypothetical protein